MMKSTTGLQPAGIVKMVVLWLAVCGSASIASAYAPAASDGPPGWWNSAWQYRQWMAIDESAFTNNVSAFPLVVRLADGQFARTLALPHGQDLRAVTRDGRPLPLKIVEWKPGGVRLYVRLPFVKTAGGQQGFYLYYGNKNAAPLQAKWEWGQESAVVMPLAGNIENEAAADLQPARKGYVVQNGWTAGLITGVTHPWVTFDRNYTGYLELKPALSAGAPLHFMTRFRATGSAHSIIFSSDDVVLYTANGEAVLQRGSEKLALPGVKNGMWQSVVFSIDPSSGNALLMLDTAALGREGWAPGAWRISTCRIGNALDEKPATQFGGDVEDVRILSGQVSRGFLTATARNLSENATLLTPGKLETKNNQPIVPAPQPQGPVNGYASYRPAGITLSWLPALGAAAYEVVLFKDAAGTRAIRTIRAGNALSLALDAAAAGHEHIYWSVRALSGKSPEIKSAFYPPSHLQFKTNAPLATAVSMPLTGIAVKAAAPQSLSKPPHVRVTLKGYMGERLKGMTRYMIDFTTRNPGLLRMLKERPEKGIPSWASVFPGQYLASAELIWRLTRDPELRTRLDAYVKDLLATARNDGYMGPFDGMQYDLSLWGHYAMVCGLLAHYENTGNRAVLTAAGRAADLVIAQYGPYGQKYPKAGGADEAFSHAAVQLYKYTGHTRYLHLARFIMEEVWNEPGGVAYGRLGVERAGISSFPVRRWEGVHNMMALSEMHWLTGNKTYAQSFGHLWHTLLKTERHNTGGFSTNEGLLGTPFNHGTIETCCTVAWSLLTTDMLRLTGSATAADELEWTTLNAALAAIPPDGSCSTYGTGAEGYRRYCELKQGPADGVELNCCSTNALRAIGNISEWAVMKKGNGLVLNYYGPSVISAALPGNNTLRLEQETAYPATGDVALQVTLERPQTFPLYVRIPAWSANTRVMVNGRPVPGVKAGAYLRLHRAWKTGDVVKLVLDMAPRVMIGQEDYRGKFSLFRGPLLFAADRSLMKTPVEALRTDNIRMAVERPDAAVRNGHAPWVVASVLLPNGGKYLLCDYPSAGTSGSYYETWLPAAGAPAGH